MKISTSIELVWQLAAKEAISGNFAEIDPDHFFLSLLKFSGLPTSDLDNLTPADRAGCKPSDEVKFLNEVLAERGIASTTVRRALRSLKGWRKSLWSLADSWSGNCERSPNPSCSAPGMAFSQPSAGLRRP